MEGADFRLCEDLNNGILKNTRVWNGGNRKPMRLCSGLLVPEEVQRKGRLGLGERGSRST